MTTLGLELGERSYDIHIGKGLLSQADKYFNLDRKVLIVTDTGVPRQYSEAIRDCARDARIVTVEMGEEAKSFGTLETLLSEMCDFSMGRGDCAVAVGGGVVGDLTGFTAACYMRGIDFYNVPTTVLSQVDSSIGGKTAINFSGIKNIIGAFHQPRGVLIDTEVLKTLDKRQISNGLCEAVKMSLTSDGELFSMFERLSEDEIHREMETVIVRLLMIKKRVVEEDERESGLRKILNFGHTLGHGIEAEEEMHGLYHGECVALGMLSMCEDSVRARLSAVLKKLSLPCEYRGNIERALEFVAHDKKSKGDMVSVIYVPRVGEYEILDMTQREFKDRVSKSGICK